MPEHSFFYLGLSLILMHEMDAVRCREWLIFPGVSRLSEEKGFLVFMLAHLPLFAFLLMGLGGPDAGSLIRGLDIFFLVHLLAHLLFLMHPKNEFRDWISWFLIAGAALMGLLDLLLG
jgi:hypothetical protein